MRKDIQEAVRVFPTRVGVNRTRTYFTFAKSTFSPPAWG